jgi:folate-binding protein YgfZ
MQRSPLLERHAAAGARLAERPEARGFLTPLTFGDVPAEVAACRRSAALFDACDRGQVAAQGSDAAAFLHRLLANEVRALGVGQGNRNLLLTPKGKLRFAMDLVREPERFLLATAPGEAASLVAALDVYLFSDDVRLADASAATAPVELAGPESAAICARVLGAPPPAEDHAALDLALGALRVRVTPLTVAGVAGLRLDAGPEGAHLLWEALLTAGAVPAGIVARDFVRVEQGSALPGVDVSEDVYPAEAGMEDAFSLEKGCYIGQEVVAKIDTYGGLNKRLHVLRVDSDAPVPAGTRLLAHEDGEARDVGVVTSWGYSFLLDTGLVLAYVKRRHQEPGTRLALGDLGLEAALIAPPGRS